MKKSTAALLALLSLVLGTVAAFLVEIIVSAVAISLHNRGASEYDKGDIDYGFGMALVFIGVPALIVLVPALSYLSWRLLKMHIRSSPSN